MIIELDYSDLCFTTGSLISMRYSQDGLVVGIPGCCCDTAPQVPYYGPPTRHPNYEAAMTRLQYKPPTKQESVLQIPLGEGPKPGPTGNLLDPGYRLRGSQVPRACMA